MHVTFAASYSQFILSDLEVARTDSEEGMMRSDHSSCHKQAACGPRWIRSCPCEAFLQPRRCTCRRCQKRWCSARRMLAGISIKIARNITGDAASSRIARRRLELKNDKEEQKRCAHSTRHANRCGRWSAVWAAPSATRCSSGSGCHAEYMKATKVRPTSSVHARSLAFAYRVFSRIRRPSVDGCSSET